jgi:hypothetical protein
VLMFDCLEQRELAEPLLLLSARQAARELLRRQR